MTGAEGPDFLDAICGPEWPLLHDLKMAKREIEMRCPICRQAVDTANEDFPFCSPRCRTIDLGRWASGAYVIPSPVADTEDDAAETRPRENSSLTSPDDSEDGE
jgi:endogenous inhibitor of DNA gyrase (YacG/DUF329 family)